MRRAGRQRVGTFTQPQEVKENCARFTPNIWLCREADHASAGGASPDHLRWLSRSANLWAVCKNVRRQFALQLDCPRIISKESVGDEKIQRRFDGSPLSGLWRHGIPSGEAARASRPQDLSRRLQAMLWQGANSEATASGGVKPVGKSPVGRTQCSAAASRQWLT